MDIGPNREQRHMVSVPAAILIGSVIIAASIVYSLGYRQPADTAPSPIDEKNLVITPVSSDDHVYGNRQATVFLVEYADMECPFCQQLHATMKKVVDGSGGKVAVVLRHFPLDSLHPTARDKARAAECAGAMGGNGKFWAMIDLLLARPPGPDKARTSLPVLAGRIGLDRRSFAACLTGGGSDAKIESDYQDGLRMGITGTPTTIAINSNGGKKVLIGAQPESAILAAISKLR